MASLTYTLPAPPSVNALWRTDAKTGRRVKSKHYSDWLSEALWRLREQGAPTRKAQPSRYREPVVAIIGVNRRNPRADLDNMAKPIFDALTKARILEDDNLITATAWAWLPPAPPGAPQLVSIFLTRADRAQVVRYLPGPTPSTGGWYLQRG